MRLALPVVVAFALTSLNIPAAMAGAVGTTLAAADLVQNFSGKKVTKVTVSTEILLNDRLKADANGNAQIELVDGTRIVVGPSAELTIDKFAFADNGTLKQLTVSATKGAFRFISGRSNHSAYSIKTPSGTIGVRGTALDITVANGGTYVALLEGAINVCDRSRKCRVVDRRCEYLFFSSRGLGATGKLSPTGRTGLAREPFPLLASQTQLMPQFRRSASSCGAQVIAPSRFASIFTPGIAPIAGIPAIGQDRPTVPVSNDDPDTPSESSGPGNPGNGKAVGGAGESPNGGNFGGTSNGHSDADGSTSPGKSASAHGRNN